MAIDTKELRDFVTTGGLGVEQQNREKLQQYLDKARQNPDSTAIACIAFTLAFSYDHFKPYDHKRANYLLTEAMEYFPNWPEALFNRGIVKIHLKDYSGAVQDLEAADQVHFGEATPNVMKPDEVDLIKGKLYTFLAEARCGRNLPGDVELARIELIRAENYFLRCVDQFAGKNPSISTAARHWLRQLPQRLKATLVAGVFKGREDGGAEWIRSPRAFLCGILAVPLLTFGFMAAAVPPATNYSPRPNAHAQQKAVKESIPLKNARSAPTPSSPASSPARPMQSSPAPSQPDSMTP